MLYLTFNDPPSGIFFSQVTDVVKMFRQEFNTDMQLISFIPARGFFANRNRIKKELPEAIVIPIMFRLRRWKRNVFVLQMLLKRHGIQSAVCRGVFACNLALALKERKRISKVCYDGRGAVYPEFEEYGMSDDRKLNRQILEMESRAVHHSDYRIAVSGKLLEYWKQNFDFKSSASHIIPCSLSRTHKQLDRSALLSFRRAKREELHYAPDNIVFVYAGSVSGWQSFDMLKLFAEKLLKKNPDYRMLFLSPEHRRVDELMASFPGLIRRLWVPHKSIQPYLCACDYGLLLREQSITNEVASPTKFAEYLAAGLKVIISDRVGDYSEFAKKHECGMVYIGDEFSEYPQPRAEEKQRMITIAIEHFSKDSEQIRSSYRVVCDAVK